MNKATRRLLEEVSSYLDLKLRGFRQDYADDHAIVRTADDLKYKVDNALAVGSVSRHRPVCLATRGDEEMIRRWGTPSADELTVEQ